MEYILSVVVPTYNTEKYLNRCIDSLIDDRINGKVEIIIVNDGSTDASLEIASKYAEKYSFVIIVDKQNGGHGSTINIGIEKARGKYFRVLDSDDWFDTDQFVRFVLDLERTNCDMIVSWGYIDYTYKNKQVPCLLWNKITTIEYNKKYNFQDVDFKGKYVVMAQLTYLTSVVKRSPQKLLENTFYVDNEFILYPIINVRTVVFFNDYVYHYFIGRPEQSMSAASINRNMMHRERVCRAMVEFIKDTKILTSHKDYIYNVVSKTILTYYEYVMFYFHDKADIETLKNFENFLEETNIELYRNLSSFLPIKLYRTFPAISERVFPYFYKMYSYIRPRQ